MAKVTNIIIDRNYGERPDSKTEFPNMIWFVKKGEKYDMVSFDVEGITSHSWDEHLCVPLNTSEEKINDMVHKYASKITDYDVKCYKQFLEDGDKYGWD